MSRPTHTKTGRKISDDLTDAQAHFAVWMSDEGQELIGDVSIVNAQRLSKILEAAFIAGSKSVDVKEICADAIHDAIEYAIPNYGEVLISELVEYADKLRQGGE